MHVTEYLSRKKLKSKETVDSQLKDQKWALNQIYPIPYLYSKLITSR